MLQLVKYELYRALGASVHDKGQEQLFTRKEEGQYNPLGFS